MSLDIEKEDLNEAEDRRKSQYISKRQLYLIVPVTLLVVFFAYFFYEYLRRQAEESVCRKNLNAVSTAMQLYLADNGDRFPPAFEMDGTGSPVIAKNAAISWVSKLDGYMTKRATFRCPSAQPEELSMNNGVPNVPSTYGFYRLWELQPIGFMADPSSEVIVAETSNRGGATSFNPQPFMSDGKVAPYDGFLIGWDTGNESLDEDSRYVTRLAFPGTQGGRFRKDGLGRHVSGIFALLGDGHLRILKPNEARIERSSKNATGIWGDH